MKRHLANLHQEHRELDKKIAGATYASPYIRELKRLRLSLKDRIRSLKRSGAKAIA